jgi:hypothetical protein
LLGKVGETVKINLEEYVRTLILASGLGEVRLVGQRPEVSLILQNHEVEIEWATLSGGDGYVPEFENQPALLFFLPFKFFNAAEEITISHLQFWATFFPDFGGIFVREGKNTGIEAIIKSEIFLSLVQEFDLSSLTAIVGNLCGLADRLRQETPE